MKLFKTIIILGYFFISISQNCIASLKEQEEFWQSCQKKIWIDLKESHYYKSRLPENHENQSIVTLLDQYHEIPKDTYDTLSLRSSFLKKIHEKAKSIYTSFSSNKYQQEIINVSQNKSLYLDKLSLVPQEYQRRNQRLPLLSTYTSKEIANAKVNNDKIPDLDPAHRFMKDTSSYQDDNWPQPDTYLISLEKKDHMDFIIDPRRQIPSLDMLVQERDSKPFNLIFWQEKIQQIADGKYLYIHREKDQQLYIFVGWRLDSLAEEDRLPVSHLIKIANAKYSLSLPAGPKIDFGNFGMMHSIIAKGENVFSAGELKFYKGQISYIDNFSGHYQPSIEQFRHSLKILFSNHPMFFHFDANITYYQAKDKKLKIRDFIRL